MTKPFKFRYVNEITGTFVLLVAGLSIVGFILAGRAHGWFDQKYPVTLLLPEAGTFGVEEGTRITILQTTVGSVDKLVVQPNGRIYAQGHVKGDFYRWFVRSDSHAIVKKTFGIAGETFVEITRGVGKPMPKEGAIMGCAQDVELLALAEEILTQIRGAVDQYTKLAGDLRDPNGVLLQLLGHLNQIATTLDNGEGTAGRLLRDPEMAAQLSNAMVQVQRILSDVEKTTTQLPSMTKTFGDEVQDASGLALQSQSMVRETKRLVEAIQKHWLIRNYLQPEQTNNWISPEFIPTTGGTK